MSSSVCLCLSTKSTNTFPLESRRMLANNSCCIVFPPNDCHSVKCKGYIFQHTAHSNFLWQMSLSSTRARRHLHTVMPTSRQRLNNLTAKSVPAGTKNSCPVGFFSRNSTKSTVNPNTTIPQIWPPWWCRLPLLRRGICGYSRSYAPTLFQRGRAGVVVEANNFNR